MNELIKDAVDVLSIEAESILNLRKYITDEFIQVAQAIINTKGKVFLSGVGKSGLIARKITATLASTGTPAFYLDPTDSYHGDLGVLSKDDLGILFSFSGETEELIRLIPLLKRMGIRFVGVSGKKNSSLLKEADFKIYTPIEKEACPMGIVPTSSTTATLAIGDALAVVLLKMRGFDKDDFAKLHPGGSLGAKLLTRVSDIMSTNVPTVKTNAKMKEAILTMTEGGLGIAVVVDDNNSLIGVITDGDLRRNIDKVGLLDTPVDKIMTKNAKYVDGHILAVDALNIMENYKITQLVVCNNQEPIGILHIHHLMNAKIA